MLNLQDFDYVFTITGGGFGKSHDLYAITRDNKVLYTNDFVDVESAEPKYLFNLRERLNFEKHSNRIVLDSPICTMYKVKHKLFGKPYLKMLYSVELYGNTPAVDTVLDLKSDYDN